jgi:hypothetical protein
LFYQNIAIVARVANSIQDFPATFTGNLGGWENIFVAVTKPSNVSSK